jgi:hypothetical protein
MFSLCIFPLKHQFSQVIFIRFQIAKGLQFLKRVLIISKSDY